MLICWKKRLHDLFPVIVVDSVYGNLIKWLLIISEEKKNVYIFTDLNRSNECLFVTRRMLDPKENSLKAEVLEKRRKTQAFFDFSLTFEILMNVETQPNKKFTRWNMNTAELNREEGIRWEKPSSICKGNQVSVVVTGAAILLLKLNPHLALFTRSVVQYGGETSIAS